MGTKMVTGTKIGIADRNAENGIADANEKIRIAVVNRQSVIAEANRRPELLLCTGMGSGIRLMVMKRETGNRK